MVQHECATVLCDPERVEDKTAATHCECHRRLFAYPTSIMKSGILVETFVGALHSSCDRLHRQHKAACHQSHEADDLQHGDC